MPLRGPLKNVGALPLVVALQGGALVDAGPARADGAAQSDDQYETPTKDPRSLDAQTPPDPDGRFPLEVRGAFGKGVQVRPSSDVFSVQVRGRVQLRAEALFPVEHPESPELVLAVRRLRVVVGGHLLGQRLTYYLQLGLGPYDLEPGLPVPVRDAFVTWHLARDVNLRAGQQKVPFDRQRVASSSRQQLVDRSLAAQELNLDRDIGVQAFSNDLLGLGLLEYQVGVFQGDGRNRVNQDLAGLVLGRLQVTPFGPFDDLVEADPARTPSPKLALATAVGVNHDSPRLRSTLGTLDAASRASFFHLTSDFIFKWAGVSASGAVLYRQATSAATLDDDGVRTARNCTRAPTTLDDAMAPLGCPSSGVGAYVQGGWFVWGDLEVAARAGVLETWSSTELPWARREHTFTAELGGGGGLYFLGHDLKIQGDAFVLPSSDGTMDVRMRTQVQIFF